MAYIYKITNTVNNKVYIGKTLGTIEKRFREHCVNSFREHCEKRPLYSAMRKYGIDKFIIEPIEETDSPDERERYWIEYYGSFRNGYNATIGGDGRPYADYGMIYSLYKEVKSIRKVKDITNYDNRTIANALRAFGVTEEEKEFNRVDIHRICVAKCDKTTGEIIEVYSSIADAERANGNTHHIADVCLGKRRTCKGFSWKYL